MGTIVAPPRRSCPTRSRTSKPTHTMRPKCLILLVAAAAMVVIGPSLSAAKSDKQRHPCGPFIVNSTTPVAVSSFYRGVQDVRSPTGRRGDEITLLVNVTDWYAVFIPPQFALKIGPELHDVSIEVADGSGTLRLPSPSPSSWRPVDKDLNGTASRGGLIHLSLRFSSKLFNGTFELDSSGNSQYNVCMSTGGYPPLDRLLDNRIRGSKPYRNATESFESPGHPGFPWEGYNLTDLAQGEKRMCRGSAIKQRGHFPVTVEVLLRFAGELKLPVDDNEAREEEVTVTAPKLFAFPARGRMLQTLREERDIINDKGPDCRSGNLEGTNWQAAWEEFGMNHSPTDYDGDYDGDFVDEL